MLSAQRFIRFITFNVDLEKVSLFLLDVSPENQILVAPPHFCAYKGIGTHVKQCFSRVEGTSMRCSFKITLTKIDKVFQIATPHHKNCKKIHHLMNINQIRESWDISLQGELILTTTELSGRPDIFNMNFIKDLGFRVNWKSFVSIPRRWIGGCENSPKNQSKPNGHWIRKGNFSKRGAVETKNNFILVLEFASKGSLGDLLEKQTTFQERTARIIIAEVIRAVQFIHDRSIIHRDLKPDNILISSQGHIKLCDFGFSTFLSSRNKNKTKSFCK